MANELTTAAKAALEKGQPDEARALADRAYRDHPDDPDARELYTALHLAAAIRLSARAREARRADIVRRNIPYETEFEDAPEVVKAFDEADAALDQVLAADPRHEKALPMRASLLFRRDRTKGREPALEILRAVVAANPATRQALYAMKKIENPCKRCSDSGFCPRCRGRGSRRILGMESKCETCHGQGICLVCGVL